jgi:aspartate racemase
MENSNNTIIGLIGGMGPYASAYFYKLLMDKSGREYGAKNNDDYPEVVLDSLPVPDFISDTDRVSEAKEMLIDRMRRLNDFGCNPITMICSTGHILYALLSKESKCELISLVDMVVNKVLERRLTKVGLLATSTTVKLGLYEKPLSVLGVEVVNPSKEMQKMHEKIIRDVIAGKRSSRHEHYLYQAAEEFIKTNKLQGVILGCTELPLVFPKNGFKNVIDCLEVLADELLARYYKHAYGRSWS